MRHFHRFWLLAALFASMHMGQGCAPTPTSSPAGTASNEGPAAASESAPGITSTAASEARWDVIFMNGQAVGYQSLTLTQQGTGADARLDATASSVLRIRRFGQVTQEAMQMASRETVDGEVLWVESKIRSGKSEIRTVGRREADVFRLEMQSGTATPTQTWSQSLSSPCGGFFAVEWSLQRHPLHPGERRSLRAFIPVLNQVAEITLTATGEAPVELYRTTIDLLRVDQQLRLPDGTVIESVAWTDADGEILKVEIPALQQVSVRVDRETALALTAAGRFDLGDFSTVRVDRDWKNPHETTHARYRIRLHGQDPREFFAETDGQSVVSVHGETLELIVRALRPGTVISRRSPRDAPPTSEDREPSAMIQSDAPVIQELVQQIPSRRNDAWSIAVATERFVFQTLTQKDFSTAFATAADVARTRQGDCTEHAVLTAALLRAQGIPARALIGLIYVGSQQGFAFHMWNEVWIDDRWIPIDATLGRGGVGAAHLILGRSSLDTGNGLAALLPVMSVMGQLEIEILEIDSEPEATTTAP